MWQRRSLWLLAVAAAAVLLRWLWAPPPPRGGAGLPPCGPGRRPQAVGASPAPRGPYRIVVDLDAMRLRLYEGERRVAEYPVAAGQPDSPSPVGEWVVVDKVWEPGGPYGARWLGLDVPWGSYGIHGTNQPGSIGWRASAGCIRLRNDDVRELYRRVEVGTPVTIVGPDPPFDPLGEYGRGAVGPDVVVLQRRLRLAGFPVSRTDGVYGAETQGRVLDLQAFFGLRRTGRAGRDEQWLIGFPPPPGDSGR